MLEQRELIAYLEDELSSVERARIDSVLEGDTAAREELESQRKISRALAALFASDTANARVKDSVLSVIRARSAEQFKAELFSDTSMCAAAREKTIESGECQITPSARRGGDSTWRETLSILWRGWLSWAGAVALLTVSLGVLFLWTEKHANDRKSLPKSRQTVKKEDLSKILDQAFDSLKQTNYHAAEPLFRRILDLSPTDPEAHYGLGEVRRSEKKLDEAAVLYRTAIKLNPLYAQPRISLGLLLQEDGQFDEAILLYQKAIELDPKEPASYINLGNIYRENRRDLARAEGLYQKAIDLSPDGAEAYNGLGLVQLQRGSLSEAETLLRKAIALSPICPRYYNNLGEVLRGAGRLDDAQKMYQEAVRLDVNYLSAYGNLAILHAMRGQLPEAENMFQAVLDRVSGPARLPALVNLASVSGDLGKTNKAEQLFREAHTLAPNEARVSYAFALFLAEHQLKLDEALTLAGQAVNTEPNNPAYLDALGWALAQNGTLDEAETNLNKAWALGSNSLAAADIRRHLAGLKQKKNSRPNGSLPP
jgi:Flp pilus assembly protein TadD